MIALLVSLGALLFAAAGVAHHIWRQREKLRTTSPAEGSSTLDKPLNPADEPDVELEP